MVTLEHGETFSLSSPSPCLGFHCTDPSALEVLEGTVVGQYDAGTTMGVSMTEIMDNPDLMAVVRSRLDGVVLLTEALNALSPVGQFTLFCREHLSRGDRRQMRRMHASHLSAVDQRR